MPQEPLNLELECELQLKSSAGKLEPPAEGAQPHRPEGGELFIVDNSDSEWKALKNYKTGPNRQSIRYRERVL